MTEKLITANEAARAMGITNVYLYRLAKAGDIPFVRIGKRAIRFAESDIKQWIEQKIRKSGRGAC